MTTGDLAKVLATWRHQAAYLVDERAVITSLTDAVLCSRAAHRTDPIPSSVEVSRSYALAGAREGAARDWLGGEPVDPETAALLNGVAVRALDLNDTDVASNIVHPSDTIPALVAVAETHGKTFTDLLVAITVCYEVVCRLNEVAQLRERGWEAASLLGIGVVAGASLLASLDDETTAEALRIVAMLSPALRCARTGRLSTWKVIAGPLAACDGVRALSMASHGVTAPADVFKDSDGFLARVTGYFDFPTDHAPRVPRVQVKLFPAQIFIQDPLRIVAYLATDYELDAGQVARLRLETFERAVSLVGGFPRRGPDGRFDEASADHSVRLCLAVMLSAGSFDVSAVRSQLSSPEVERLVENTDVRADEAASKQYPGRLWSRVTIETIDGRVLAADSDDLEPIDPGDLGVKFGHLPGTSDVHWPWDLEGAPVFPSLIGAVRETRKEIE